MKSETIESYRNRVLSVVEYMRLHLDQPLDLARLADVAYFSPYHFHRVYRELMHETVRETLRRLRLHRAAADLIRTRLPLERIARDAGYGSVSSFSHAFVKAVGKPPAAYRECTRMPLDLSTFIHPQETKIMPNEAKQTYEVNIRQFDDIRVASLPHRGDYMEIGQVFEKLFQIAAGQNLVRNDTRSFGIYYDDPASIDKDKLRSEACLSITADQTPITPLKTVTIAAGNYAVLVFKGPYAELEPVYQWLYGQWLPQSGYECANQPLVEEYLNDPKSLPPSEWQTAICMPIKMGD